MKNRMALALAALFWVAPLAAQTATDSVPITIEGILSVVVLDSIKGPLKVGDSIMVHAKAFDVDGDTVRMVVYSWSVTDTAYAAIQPLGGDSAVVIAKVKTRGNQYIYYKVQARQYDQTIIGWFDVTPWPEGVTTEWLHGEGVPLGASEIRFGPVHQIALQQVVQLCWYALWRRETVVIGSYLESVPCPNAFPIASLPLQYEVLGPVPLRTKLNVQRLGTN